MTVEQEQYALNELTRGLYFGESPRWRDGTLYVSDMLGKKVYAIDAAGNRRVIAEMPHKPNGMGFLPNGELILSSMHEARLYRYTPQGPELYADLSAVFTGYVGDMVIDQQGRIYVDDVGARVFEGEPLKPGRIVIVEPNGEISVGVEDCNFPNGIVITPDQKTLVFVETFAERLSAVDIVDGQLVNRRVLLDLTLLFPSPEDRARKRGCVDGISIDAEGGIWLSMLRAEQFMRISPRAKSPTASRCQATNAWPAPLAARTARPCSWWRPRSRATTSSRPWSTCAPKPRSSPPALPSAKVRAAPSPRG